MKISDIAITRQNGRARVSARVTWEDCDREGFELYFETAAKHASMLSDCADTFLIANLIPAYEYGESRIHVADPICSALRTNIEVASAYAHHWHYRDRKTLDIETERIVDRPTDVRRALSAQMFSGGLDSYATLALNRQFLGTDHPDYTRTAILAFGLEQDDPTAFGYVTEVMRSAARELDLILVPVESNVYLPYREEDSARNWQFWVDRLMCTALASFGHALSAGCTQLSIAASDFLAREFTCVAADNPLVQENLSSARMRIRHSGGHLSRLEKTRIVARSPTMLRHLRVCNQYKRYAPGKLNCGRCEKCVRTMIGLLAVGALEQTPCFASFELNAGLIDSIVPPRDNMVAATYQESLDLLRSKGHNDLIKPLQRVISRALGKKRTRIVSLDYRRRVKRAVGRLKKAIG